MVRCVAFIEPCLPSRAERPPSGPGWVHGIKHDSFVHRARLGYIAPDGSQELPPLRARPFLPRIARPWCPQPAMAGHPAKTQSACPIMVTLAVNLIGGG